MREGGSGKDKKKPSQAVLRRLFLLPCLLAKAFGSLINSLAKIEEKARVGFFH